MKLGDEELMAMFSAGMSEAFDMLYERYRHRLFRFALSCLKSQEDAEDTVQEVFLRVARAAPRYQPQGKFKAWLFQIAANRIRSMAIQKNRPENVSDDEVMLQTDSYDQEHRLIQQERLQNILLTLPSNQRVIVLLRELEGMDIISIASILDMSASNVRVQLHRARKALLSQFQHQHWEKTP